MQEVFPTELARELAKIHLKVEFDPRTQKMHAHIQRSLARVYSKFSASALVSLFVQRLHHNFSEKLHMFFACPINIFAIYEEGVCKADIKGSSAARAHTCLSSQTLPKQGSTSFSLESQHEEFLILSTSRQLVATSNAENFAS